MFCDDIRYEIEGYATHCASCMTSPDYNYDTLDIYEYEYFSTSGDEDRYCVMDCDWFDQEDPDTGNTC